MRTYVQVLYLNLKLGIVLMIVHTYFSPIKERRMTDLLCSAAGLTWTYDNKFLVEKYIYGFAAINGLSWSLAVKVISECNKVAGHYFHELLMQW